MTSIMTNTSAMVALQTLKGINSGLSKTQSEISTGLRISNAKDNAAVFAISTIMKSDVAGFGAVSDSLALGESTLAVAAGAAKKVGSLLNDIKSNLISSREQNVDRTKLSNEVTSLTNQINGIVSAAQFNGLNLLDGGLDMTILSSLDRTATGVTTSSITVASADTDLSTAAGTAVGAIFDAAQTGVNTDKSGFAASLDPTDTYAVTLDSGAAPAAGRIYSMTLNGKTATYTAVTGDTNNEVAYGLRDAISALGITGVTSAVTPAAAPGTNDVVLTLTNGGSVDLAVSGEVLSAGAGGLQGIGDAATWASGGATDANLASIETMIQNAANVQAALGTAQSRVEKQADFMLTLTDAFNTGIGSLVDADMEEASARLQALQTQQQLGIQALSIANQQPQNILSLFK